MTFIRQLIAAHPSLSRRALSLKLCEAWNWVQATQPSDVKSNPEVIELDEADLESKLDQIEAALGAEMAEPFRLLLGWYACLLGLLREKKLSIRRLPEDAVWSFDGTDIERCILRPRRGHFERECRRPIRLPWETPSTTENPGRGSDCSREKCWAPPPARPWRIPASSYTGCAQVVVTHESLHPATAVRFASTERCTVSRVGRRWCV